MGSSFGSRLRADRERQQVTLETIAERTKIRVALLDGLERDDLSHWPTGIFRRSYLRSYAAAIGLDQEQTVREFLAAYPDPVEETEAVIAANAEAQRADRRPPMRLQYLLASAFGALSPKSRTATPAGAAETAVVAQPGLSLDSIAPPQAEINAADIEVTGGAFVMAEPTGVAEAALSAANEPADEERHGGLDEELELAYANDVGDAVAPVQVDLPAMAQLCTRIGEAKAAADLEQLLEEACRVLHAVGIIVWLWDPNRGVLWPSLSHGYSRQMLAKLPALTPDAENPIGAALRASATQVVAGGGSATSAIVVPVMTPGGCAGVLAVECASGLEQESALQALATILAAQLSILVDAQPAARTAIA